MFILILMQFLFITNSASAGERIPVIGKIGDERVAALAQSFSKTYREGGMLSLSDDIKKCYINYKKNKSKTSECVIKDMAATKINHVFFDNYAKGKSVPDSDFFSTYSFNIRISVYVSETFSSVDELDYYVGNSYERLMIKINNSIK